MAVQALHRFSERETPSSTSCSGEHLGEHVLLTHAPLLRLVEIVLASVVPCPLLRIRQRIVSLVDNLELCLRMQLVCVRLSRVPIRVPLLCTSAVRLLQLIGL